MCFDAKRLIVISSLRYFSRVPGNLDENDFK